MLREVTAGYSECEESCPSPVCWWILQDIRILHVVVRGLRAISDFDYELQMAQTNRKMNPHVDTMFLATSLEYAYLSSSNGEGSSLISTAISMNLFRNR